MARSQDRIEQSTSSEIQHPERTCLLIAGMHRSGTSALARVLSLLGADLPRTLMEGSEANKVSNASGHWESEAAARLGDIVLDSAGTDWRSPEPVSPAWYHSSRYQEMRERAVRLLKDEFGDSPLFVFKDPRVCKLMPFWLDVLDQFGVTTRVVSILRSPLEVAASLHARNGFDLSIGQLLWLRYVLDAEAASRAISRVFVTYDRLLENAGDVTARIGTSLDLVWPRASLKTDGEISGFLSASHRHHARELDPTTGSERGLTPLLADVYAILTRWALEGEVAGDRPTLDRSREELDRALALLGEPVSLALHQGSQLRRFKSHDKERDAQFKAVEERARVAEAKADVAQSNAEKRQGVAQAALADALDKLSALQAAQARVLKECQDARIMQARLEERLVATEANRKAALDTCERLEAKLEAARRDCETLLAQVHEAQLDQVRREEKIAALQRELTQLDGTVRELEQARSKLSQIEQDCDRKTRLANENARKFEARTTQLEALRVEHGLSIEARKASSAKLDELRSEITAIGLKLEEQQSVAAERQAAIEHLREDRAKRVAERDERIRKLETQIESLQVQLSIANARSSPPAAEGSLPMRVGLWLRLPGALTTRRRTDQLELLRTTELFNGWWYLSKYEDVRIQGLDPAEHYLDHGAAEGRSPGPDFDARWYLEINPDVREAGVNPLLHYLEHGRGEGREIRSLADSKRQRIFADAPAGTIRTNGPNSRSELHAASKRSPEFTTHFSIPRKGSRDKNSDVAGSGLINSPDASAFRTIGLGSSKASRWLARSLSFSSLSSFADLDRDIAAVGEAAGAATDSPVMVGDIQVACGKSQVAASSALAACQWGAWLGLMGPQSDAVGLPPPAETATEALRLALNGGELTLVDAWFANLTELNLRLRGSPGTTGVVLRAYQPDASGGWFDCGEAGGAGTGETIVRLNLRTHFAPLLLTLIDTAGYLVDSTLLVFPSLCRGGVHFGELATSSCDAGMLVAARERSLELLNKHIAASTGGPPTVLSHIEIGIDGADGTEPALDSDLLNWLINDLGMNVTVRSGSVNDSSNVAIKAQVAAFGSPAAARPAGACLVLAARAVPTLGALFATKGDLAGGACRTLYMSAVAGSATHGFDYLQDAELIDRLTPPQGKLMPRLQGDIVGDPGLSATSMVDLAIYWPETPPVAVQAFFPSGVADISAPLEVPAEARPLSVIVDATSGQIDISAVLFSIDSLRKAFDIKSVIVCHAPGEQPSPPVVPEGLADKMQIVSVSRNMGTRRLTEALQAANAGECAGRVLVLDETVVLHDARVADLLWSACELEGVGSASCPLVSELVGAKGRMHVHLTAGWIEMIDFKGNSSFAVVDLADYSLPAVLPVVAPDLRCAMVDAAHLIASGAAGEDDLGFGLSLCNAGLANLCLTTVAATTSAPRCEHASIEESTVLHSALRLRSFRQ
ncbi:hypothetical protein SAMN06295987_11428 [Novosphingobium mathurense]|uniref:Uncharacterized protein n=2 Tax=Novosphingobium mathurense TaxID=428990 RepID=A0A1U6ITQ1_9SPHN|nr:hypothetical protein SAMN06295987_11428 [Novosphingobium mathurense]